MFLVSNTCIGAFIMRDYLKIPFNNPFCWNIIRFPEFYNVIKNFVKEDFEFKKIWIANNDKKYVKIKTKNNLIIKFFHYRYGEIEETKNINGMDFYSPNILEIAKNKYKSRYNRMINNNENPIFIVGGGNALNGKHNIEKSDVEKLKNIKNNKIICITNNSLLDKKFNIKKEDNLYIIELKEPKDWTNEAVAKLVYDNVLKTFEK